MFYWFWQFLHRNWNFSKYRIIKAQLTSYAIADVKPSLDSQFQKTDFHHTQHNTSAPQYFQNEKKTDLENECFSNLFLCFLMTTALAYQSLKKISLYRHKCDRPKSIEKKENESLLCWLFFLSNTAVYTHQVWILLHLLNRKVLDLSGVMTNSIMPLFFHNTIFQLSLTVLWIL